MLVVLASGRAMKDDRTTGNVFRPDKLTAFATGEQQLLAGLIAHG